MGRVVEKEARRRCARAGRPPSWVREGACAGHHRGLRAGQVFRGGTRERGRAPGLLDDRPGVGDRVPTGPGAVWARRPGTEPGGETTNDRSTQGIGKRATSEATREGHGGSRSVAYYQGTWGSEAQATHGREGAVEQSIPRAGTRGETPSSPTLTPVRQWTAEGSSRGSA